MARIQGIPANRAGLLTRFTYWLARRRLGEVPEPLTVTAHHRWISVGAGVFELALERSRLLEERVKLLASIKTAMMVGCPF